MSACKSHSNFCCCPNLHTNLHNLQVVIRKQPSVTRAFFESLIFFKNENVEKFLIKGQNCIKIDLCNKIQFTEFLLLNIVDQIFKISTIVETLVTVPMPTYD